MNQEGLSVKKLTEEQSWLQTGALLVLAFVAFSFGVAYARDVLVPFTMALFLNYLVAPIVDFQMIRLKFSRFVAVTITVLLVVLALILASFVLLSVIQNVTAVSADDRFFDRLEQRLEGPLNSAFEFMDHLSGIEEDEPLVPIPEDAKNEDEAGDGLPVTDSDEATDDAPGTLNDAPQGENDLVPTPPSVAADLREGEPARPSSTEVAAEADIEDVVEDALTDVAGLPQEPLSGEAAPRVSRTRQFLRSLQRQFREEAPQLAAQAGGTVVNMISSTVLTSIFVGFMLAGRDPYRISKGIYAEIDRNVRRYIATKFFISALTGLLVWGILATLGLRFASIFGLFAFGLNFIPSIGSIIATLLPIPIALVQFDSFWMITLAIALPSAVQMALGNVIEPKIQGDGLQLHPVTILLALAFFGMLWGPVGMLLAAPITASIRIVLMRFATTDPIGQLMAGILLEEKEEAEGAES